MASLDLQTCARKLVPLVTMAASSCTASVQEKLGYLTGDQGCYELGRLQEAGGCGSPELLGVTTSQCLQASSYCPPAVLGVSALCLFSAKNKVLFAHRAKGLGPPEKIRRGNRTQSGLQAAGTALGSQRLEARSWKWHFPRVFMFSWGLINNQQNKSIINLISLWPAKES